MSPTAYEASVGWGRRSHAVILAGELPPRAEREGNVYTTACGRRAAGEDVYATLFLAPRPALPRCPACVRRVQEQIPREDG